MTIKNEHTRRELEYKNKTIRVSVGCTANGEIQAQATVWDYGMIATSCSVHATGNTAETIRNAITEAIAFIDQSLTVDSVVDAVVVDLQKQYDLTVTTQ